VEQRDRVLASLAATAEDLLGRGDAVAAAVLLAYVAERLGLKGEARAILALVEQEMPVGEEAIASLLGRVKARLKTEEVREEGFSSQQLLPTLLLGLGLACLAASTLLTGGLVLLLSGLGSAAVASGGYMLLASRRVARG
jgi:hypothetical protein